jgi:hypothetical protein
MPIIEPEEMTMRADGRRVKNVDPMNLIEPYIMDKRYDAMNMVTLDIPVEPMQEYMKKRRREGRPVSHMALVMAAYLRTAWEFPRLNRFIVNKRIYERNEFCVSLVVLKPGDDDNATMDKIYFDMTDDIDTVQEKVERFISENKVEESVNSMDKVMHILASMPVLLSIAIKLFKFMDRHGWLPKSLIDASPFHASLSLTNLASIRTNHIYHHVYEFGTISVFVAMGSLRDVPMRENKEVVLKRCLPLGVVMDERICSGNYFAKAFTRFRKYLDNPTLLEGPPVAQGADA